ncbi:hypothetical protein GCM10009775_04280 [Microbacterium aoyamense]|uniref:Uncharacterized protein n=1 Tax=Microbacterium aoyamense TaxID=344166 RepID=A0ABN2P952_9MICO|nr:hypothetical protein [Microbacterium aoyamense]
MIPADGGHSPIPVPSCAPGEQQMKLSTPEIICVKTGGYTPTTPPGEPTEIVIPECPDGILSQDAETLQVTCHPLPDEIAETGPGPELGGIAFLAILAIAAGIALLWSRYGDAVKQSPLGMLLRRVWPIVRVVVAWLCFVAGVLYIAADIVIPPLEPTGLFLTGLVALGVWLWGIGAFRSEFWITPDPNPTRKDMS